MNEQFGIEFPSGPAWVPSAPSGNPLFSDADPLLCIFGPGRSTELEADVRIALSGVFQFLCRSVGLC